MVKTELIDREGFIELLVKRGLTMKTLALLSGVGYSSLQQVTSGKRTPTPTVAIKICKTLEMEFEELFKFKHGGGRTYYKRAEREEHASRA